MDERRGLARQNRCIAGDDDLAEVFACFERLVGLNGLIQRVRRSDFTTIRYQMK